MNGSRNRSRAALWLIAALAVVFSAADVSAQGMRRSPEDQAKALKDSLGLDAKQAEAVTAIYKDQQAAMMNAFQSASGDRESMRETMQEIVRTGDEKIMKVLNEGQKKKYAEMVKNRPLRGGMRQRMN